MTNVLRWTIMLLMSWAVSGFSVLHNAASPHGNRPRPKSPCIQKNDDNQRLAHGVTTTTTRVSLANSGKDNEKTSTDTNTGKSTTSLTSIWNTLQEKPGGLILLPFVALFGFDLLLNIFFLTKRTFEFFVLGQAPSQETWY